MHFSNKYMVVAAIAFTTNCSAAFAQTAADASPYYQPLHQRQLKELRTKAQGLVDKNLNRFGLLELKRYDILSDSLFATECADTVAGIETAFRNRSADKLAAIDTNRREINSYGKQQVAAKSAFFGLFRKSLFALAAWLLIVFLILRFRNKKVRAAEADLAVAKLQSNASESTAITGNQAAGTSERFTASINTAADAAAIVESKLSESHEKLPAGDDRIVRLESALQQSASIASSLKREAAISSDAALQTSEPSEEKSKRSINRLCDHYLELCYRGHCKDESNPFECQVSRDLEKNLPEVAIYAEEVGALLTSVLDNAFLAVKERAAKMEKGYTPKVAVSTRVLPRFIQIRVKDNGGGIPDDLLEKIEQEHFSTRPVGEGAGIGLAYAKKILSERHKGELKIESEKGNGTDVYMKFFT